MSNDLSSDHPELRTQDAFLLLIWPIMKPNKMEGNLGPPPRLSQIQTFPHESVLHQPAVVLKEGGSTPGGVWKCVEVSETIFTILVGKGC